MGFLDRVIGGTNAVYERWTDLTTVTDPTLGAASRRMAEGELAAGTITGIRRRLNDEMAVDLLAVTATAVTGDVHRFGIQPVFPARAMARLHLGLQVPLRIDGRRAVIDGPALGAALGMALDDPTQRSKRSVPDDGIDDELRSRKVAKGLKAWPEGPATITSFEPTFVLGMQTDGWDVHVQLADGRTAHAPKDLVPFYVQSIAAPGTELLVAVDPSGDTVAIDWPAFARTTSGPPDPTTPPPPGSIAAQLQVAAPAPPASGPVAVGSSPAVPAAPPPGVVTNHALRTWVDGVKGGYMKPKELEQGARDLVEVGMVTQEEADAALREAGLR